MSEALDVNKEQQISIRLEPDVASRAEGLVAKLTTLPEFRPFRLTRAAVLRMAMLEGLAALERRYGEAPAVPPPAKTKKRTAKAKKRAAR